MDQMIERHRTAIRRVNVSRPVRLAVDAGVITKSRTVLDYGCGHGGDVDYLCSQGIQCCGWDPVHQPNDVRSESDVVNLGFVVNVIED